MKKFLLFGLMMTSISASTFTYPPQWFSTWSEAVQQSALSDKPILMVFSGSDWCKPCMILEKTVFDAPDFQAYATQHLVLLKVDFPRQKKNRLPEIQRQHNEGLAAKYNPNGEFPFLLLLNASGDLLSKVNQSPTSSLDFICQIQHLFPGNE